ncbi:rho guanine nucleotide exchange factor 1 isoform X4 [Pelobates cultripes]|uniref:Rho guanine nucleotide exchange factor 1 isoform X4 n=1 Tax=Pelobates cultripes TaxID=61616 RepID=A0AAD1T3Z8_PELCU|nr:rho guanine nucleotide exchange factor 1 isoform X4 [Pelobates cultripes]
MDPEDGHSGGFHSMGATSIIGAEDEDFENEIEANVEDHNSPFQNIELVKDHPAYIMVFLHHVVLQLDPCPLLCYLHADIIKNLSVKEGKKLFTEFCYTFMMKGAVLRTTVPTSVSFELDRTRPELFTEDTQKKFLREVQSYQIPEISRQLEDFRSKRVLGMTPGELELNELESYRTSDRHILESKEKQLAEQLLARLDEVHPTISTDEDKSSAVFCAIVTYMKHLGVKTKVADSKKSKGIFFRKKVSSKKPDETVKTKKTFSILDPTRWKSGESHSVDNRPSKSEPEAVDKPVVHERRISHGQKTFDRSDSSNLVKPKLSVGAPPDMTESVVSVTVHAPPSEPSDSDTATLDGSTSLDISDASKGSPTMELCPGEPMQEDNAENESPEPGGSTEGPLSFLLPQSEENEPRVPEAESDPPNWRELVPPETLLSLKKNEIKRQEVINELIFTEHAHVRMLHVLHDIFYLPMQDVWIPQMELQNIFPSLDDLIEAHVVFLETLKRLRLENNYVIQEIGTTLLNRFDGTEGSWFQKISSRFCSRQPFALEQLKQKQKKDPRFTQFIQEAESHPQCRRLQLKDIIPFEMQRLTKYPLLLQNIANLTDEEEEKQKVQKAAECCRQILNHVNQEVREMENHMKLNDYQRRLDVSNLRVNDLVFNEFKNIDISKKNLIYEGSLLWRVSKDKAIDVHVLLLDDMLMLLQKQDERLVLKCQSRTIMPTPDGKLMLIPIIKLDSAMAREVATDNKAFFVIFKWDGKGQIYELVAPTVSEKKIWFSLIKETTGSLDFCAPSRSGLRSGNSSGMIPQSPSYFNEPVLRENGDSLKDSVNKDDKKKSPVESGQEETVGDTPNLMEHLLAHNIAVCKMSQESTNTGGNLASEALEEVLVLKRLLVKNIRLSLDADSLSFIELNSAKGEELAPAESTTNGNDEDSSRDTGENGAELSRESQLDGGDSLCAPIVLSQEQSEEVRRHIQVLEQRVQQLKMIEEDYNHLQRTIAKFTVSQSSFT